MNRISSTLAFFVVLSSILMLGIPPTAVSATPATIAITAPTASSPASTTAPRQDQALPLYFEANAGQTDSEVAFLARTEGYTLYLTPNRAVFSLKALRSISPAITRTTAPISTYSHVEMRLLNANAAPRVQGETPLTGYSNYLLGRETDTWLTEVPHYAQVRYESVYAGVDLVYYEGANGLQYDFILAPQTDPNQIQMGFSADSLRLNPQGELVIQADEQVLTQSAPYSYQDIDGQHVTVESRFTLLDAHTVGFQLGDYDPDYTLVIDPAYDYSTYLGGTDNDRPSDIIVDSSGNAYITGQTDSINFPVRSAFSSNRGLTDAFITKLQPDGSNSVYSTYIGGDLSDTAHAIALDANNNAVIVGETGSNNFPITASAVSNQNNGARDAFLAKLSADGTQVLVGTYLGGGFDDIAYDLALDGVGNAYVTGSTLSNDFPFTTGAYQFDQGGTDAFVTKINSSATSLIYSSYLGGASTDVGRGIGVDVGGNVIVSGYTDSTDYPLVTSFQGNNGGRDIFLTKLNSSGSAALYSTYYGGTQNEEPSDLFVDDQGVAYLTGFTASTNLPLSSSPFQTDQGAADAFAAKFAADGRSLVYATYLGGDEADVGDSISVDSSGYAYITGHTYSNNFPMTDNAEQGQAGAGADAFVTMLNQNGTALTYSTYLGGGEDDFGTGIHILNGQTLFVTGYTSSDDFPITATPYLNYRGQEDGFVTRYDMQNNSTPVALAVFNTNGQVSLLNTLQDQPGNANYINFNVSPPIQGDWLMGDWNGDGQKTPGIFGSAAGAFYYTNDLGANVTWGSAWVGPVGQPVAGRFNPNRLNDCIGVVEQSSADVGGSIEAVFVLWYACDFSTNTPTVTWHWASAPLMNVDGFAGEHQFVVGDWDGNGLDTVAVRRGEFIAYSNVQIVDPSFSGSPPFNANNTGAEFAFAQFFPSVSELGQPGANSLLVAGDWDMNGTSSFGILHSNDFFYYKNDLEWNSRVYELQRISSPINNPRTVVAWNLENGFTIGALTASTQPVAPIDAPPAALDSIEADATSLDDLSTLDNAQDLDTLDTLEGGLVPLD